MKAQLAGILSGLLLAIVPAFMHASGIIDTDSLTPVKAVTIEISNGLLYRDVSFTDSMYGIAAGDPMRERKNIEMAYAESGDDRSALLRLLKVMRVRRILHYRQSRQLLYSDLANVSARLSLYPFAMQCYYQSVNPEDSVTGEIPPGRNADTLYGPDIPMDTSISEISTDWKKESNPVRR